MVLFSLSIYKKSATDYFTCPGISEFLLGVFTLDSKLVLLITQLLYFSYILLFMHRMLVQSEVESVQKQK